MFKSETEIDKLYSDHLDSMRMTGMLTDEGEAEILSYWQQALDDYRWAVLTQRR